MTFCAGWVQKSELLKGVILNTNLPIVRESIFVLMVKLYAPPAPRYGSDGRRINKGLRLDKDGSLVKTRDEFGNPILGTHNTGEKVRN
ncbi:hypothetical protein [Microcoleus sp. N9_A2]|uniref:hypothetical protein n=1 Tax=Microcoleus sp. N9_A2 TaxID=3055381 RepID=UPI002FD6397A